MYEIFSVFLFILEEPMESNKIFLIITFLLIWTNKILTITQCNFNSATKEIENQRHGFINYTTFCSKKSSGSNKLACRIGKVPSVAFLVCKRPFYKDNTSCKEVIESELKNILELQRKYHIKTVDVHNKTFENVSCGTASNNICSGLLECWIDKTLGEFKKPRNHILYGKYENRIFFVRS